MTHPAVRAVERGLTLRHFAAYVAPAAATSPPPALDPGRARDRAELLRWLRSWGCRHLRVADDAMSSRELGRWARVWIRRLPACELTDLDAGQREAAASAFEALSTAHAAFSARQGGQIVVTFGATGAAKALYALRPATFPPWDAPIRRGLGLTGDGAGYAAYLELTARLLGALAARAGVDPADLPRAAGRPSETAARLIDEYLWRRITRGVTAGTVP